jgi:hypothetical protein
MAFDSRLNLVDGQDFEGKGGNGLPLIVFRNQTPHAGPNIFEESVDAEGVLT